MKITIVQSTVEPGKINNLHHIKELLKTPLDTDMIVFGEMFISPYENSSFQTHFVKEFDIFFDVMKELCLLHNAYIVAGSVPELEKGKLYNTTYVFDPNGNVVTKYRKIHLFEIAYPDGTTYKESDTISRGEEVITFETPYGVFGLMICFDVRFPKLAEILQNMGCDIILVPAAFNDYTGPLHWTTTFKARAIDNQLYVIGVSPSAFSAGNYNYYGHSIAVDPLGKTIVELHEKEEITTIEIDLKKVEEVRTELPIIKNKIYLKE